MREDVVKQRVSECLPMYKGTMQKAYDGKASPRGAIKAMCLHCVGYQRADITACTGFSCPLWQYRPYQAGEDVPGVTEAAEETV